MRVTGGMTRSCYAIDPISACTKQRAEDTHARHRGQLRHDRIPFGGALDVAVKRDDLGGEGIVQSEQAVRLRPEHRRKWRRRQPGAATFAIQVAPGREQVLRGQMPMDPVLEPRDRSSRGPARSV